MQGVLRSMSSLQPHNFELVNASLSELTSKMLELKSSRLKERKTCRLYGVAIVISFICDNR